VEYSFQDKGANTTVSFSGDMTFSDHQLIRELISQLASSNPNSVIIDLSALRKIDSAGIGMLMLMDDAAKENNFSLSLRGASGLVEKVLDVCKISEVINVI
jgi:HptB-dependent secretion and biofilm anti anti-sigma factor